MELQHVRSFYVAEFCALYFDPPVRLQADITYFCANGLSFPVAIRPYEKSNGAPRLCLNVFLKSFFVLGKHKHDHY